MHARLLAGVPLNAVVPPVPGLLQERGEYAVGVVTGGVTYQRYSTANVDYGRSSAMVMGSQEFVAGFVITSLLLRGRRRRQAQRMAAPQWRSRTLRRVVMTTRRLWCEIDTDTGPTWLHFNHDEITGLSLQRNMLMLRFISAPPLCLTGGYISWCAAVIAHYRYRELLCTTQVGAPGDLTPGIN